MNQGIYCCEACGWTGDNPILRPRKIIVKNTVQRGVVANEVC